MPRYYCGEVLPMVTYIEMFTYTLVLVAVVTLVLKIKKKNRSDLDS